MEKVLLKNKVERMEKLLENQKNQQSQLAENYFALVDMLVKFQNQKNSSDSTQSLIPGCVEEILRNRLKLYLRNCPENLDKSRKEELTNSLLYLSNLSKNVNLNEDFPLKHLQPKLGQKGTQQLLNDSLKLLRVNSQQFSNKSEGKKETRVTSRIGGQFQLQTREQFTDERIWKRAHNVDQQQQKDEPIREPRPKENGRIEGLLDGGTGRLGRAS